jgi:hypothetical protein
MRRACPILFVVFIAGCVRGSGPPVDMVLPKGYTGPVWIMLDPDGQDIPLVNGRYQVAIPADGTLRVQSFGPFQQFHQTSARYDDGSPLPPESGANPAGPGVVALWGGGSAVTKRNGREVRWMPYFVGTEAEFHARPAMDFPPGVGP